MNDRNDGLWQGGPWEQGARLTPPDPIPEPQRPVLVVRRRRRRRMPWFGWLFIALFAVGVIGTGIQLAVDYFAPEEDIELPPYFQIDPDMTEEETSRIPPSIPQAPTGTGVTLELKEAGPEPLTYTEIYDRNFPSIVSLDCIGPGGGSTGTGIILTEDGYIVTNAHVVAEARSVDVYFHDNRSLEARLVGFDPDEDIAVLKVEASGLTPAEFGDSNLLRCGDPVAALGDPLGYRSTITNGIVSALDREVETDAGPMLMIQTSAAINFGNSGGALINQYGQVVGITSIKIVSTDGSAEALGFAIPSRRVKYVADTLMDGRMVTPGVFGITVTTYPAKGGGLEIIEVDPHSDAARQGVRAGDVIRAANGVPVNTTQDLARIKMELGAGDPVELLCIREGSPLTFTVDLIARPKR